LGGFQPEQITINDRDQIIPFKALLLIERGLIERGRALTFRMQPCDLTVDSCMAEVWKLAVELVPSIHYGDVGVEREVCIQVLVHVGIPIGRRCARIRQLAATCEQYEYAGQPKEGL
jgi:hypothetical protein